VAFAKVASSKGCLAGYQADPSYGTAVFFALKAVWGIARDLGIRAEVGTLDPAQLDEHSILPVSFHAALKGLGGDPVATPKALVGATPNEKAR
jgi:hypothetical protein